MSDVMFNPYELWFQEMDIVEDECEVAVAAPGPDEIPLKASL